MRILWNLEVPRLGHGVIRQKLCEDAFVGFVPIGATGFGKQIREFFALARRLSNRLQTEEGNQPGSETFALLNAHRIENTTV